MVVVVVVVVVDRHGTDDGRVLGRGDLDRYHAAAPLERPQSATGVPTPSTAAASRPSAKDILDARLARGEIEADDLRKRLEALTDANTLHWHSIALRNEMDDIHDFTRAGVQPGE